ncbi:hypothetical protein [Clostridium chauvoei]|uniref:Reticulocyte-binding protein n=2 Tax=Clostridium chauvoei TaxID=46867 RepID=A0A1U6J234_9CLOT|nr:hypothetical protein [Clostridium chauvoei]ATD54420.1 hypothetical protein BTM20_03895 [Clostridium chauvoei]ATD57896.1 hypothetical protein BTM21_09165 [Clostridium chauvoei]MBX7279685.1 hypothetical protein [Clostridium chauvoei]MBX7282054.1 hypothetical protein [Clostridium chauvoei]MBX7284576.1 hypothetical protein [Clostridium chauvoei]
MKAFKFSKNNSILFIVGVLLISLIVNVYMSVVNSSYRYEAKKQSYNNIEQIRHRNESISLILDQGIKSGSISNEELLKLYKNYSSISKSMTDLWSEYGDYSNQSIISLSKKKIEDTKPNEICERIENLIFGYLTLEMETLNNKLVLKDKILEDFKVMQDMSKDLEKFYKEFNDTVIQTDDENKKKDKFIKKDYWIDVLKGINTTIEPYINYDFTID